MPRPRTRAGVVGQGSGSRKSRYLRMLVAAFERAYPANDALP